MRLWSAPHPKAAIVCSAAVPEWFGSGSGVVREWFGNGSGMVREWFGCGSGVVRVWFGCGSVLGFVMQGYWELLENE
eukprot:2735430-Amphidinium_carterae.1